MNDPGSSRQVALPEADLGHHAVPTESHESLVREPASQPQIIRSHQRDSAQVHRLIELVSEIARSLAGTRWLAHKQTLIDLVVRAVYLLLTLGRGKQTLGEEYTDIVPFSRRAGVPGRVRRGATILFLLFPSVLISPGALAYLRRPSGGLGDGEAEGVLDRWKRRLADLVESPLGQSLPEIHMVLFLFGGRFFEFGRRSAGMGYVSTQPPRTGARRHPSFEPLGFLLALPLLYRLLPRRSPLSASSASVPSPGSANTKPHSLTSALAPDLTPALLPGETERTLLLARDASYDTPNTYLSPEALALPERQCTLCLEPRGTGEGSGGTVGVTECGHVFCWGCLGGLEKLECPLCRQTLRMERLIAAYNL